MIFIAYSLPSWTTTLGKGVIFERIALQCLARGGTFKTKLITKKIFSTLLIALKLYVELYSIK